MHSINFDCLYILVRATENKQMLAWNFNRIHTHFTLMYLIWGWSTPDFSPVADTCQVFVWVGSRLRDQLQAPGCPWSLSPGSGWSSSSSLCPQRFPLELSHDPSSTEKEACEKNLSDKDTKILSITQKESTILKLLQDWRGRIFTG